MKSSLLKRASLVCVICDLYGGKYKIVEILKNKIPEKIQRVNNRDKAEKIILSMILSNIINNQCLDLVLNI